MSIAPLVAAMNFAACGASCGVWSRKAKCRLAKNAKVPPTATPHIAPSGLLKRSNRTQMSNTAMSSAVAMAPTARLRVAHES